MKSTGIVRRVDELTVSKTKVEFLREIVARYKKSDSDIEQSMGEGIELALDILGLPKEAKS